MRSPIAALCLVLGSMVLLPAKTVVFWQEGFPVTASQPVARDVLAKALGDADIHFDGIDGLKSPGALAGAELLVLPYGSSIPADAWGAIQGHLQAGGNLLVLGGQPFRVPVRMVNGSFVKAPEQDSYSREFGIQHTYVAPEQGAARFEWRTGYSFWRAPGVRARRYFVLEGRLNGLGYMLNPEGVQVAAPVVVMERAGGTRGGRGAPAATWRAVMLPFEPEAGYWESPDGVTLIRSAAAYARRGPVTLTLEMPFSTLMPDETPRVVAHLRGQKELGGEVKVELVSGNSVLESLRAPCAGTSVDTELTFRHAYPPGFYVVRGVWEENGEGREAYQNGFWVEDRKLLTTGPALGVQSDFLTRNGKPFFPVGANYFSTEANGWDFAGPRNAWIWERDFAEMQQHGVNFVRTGVWALSARQLDRANGGVTERFLRNLEAFLLSARRHNIIVNWTFYAFTPNPVDPTQPATPQSNDSGCECGGGGPRRTRRRSAIASAAERLPGPGLGQNRTEICALDRESLQASAVPLLGPD